MTDSDLIGEVCNKINRAAIRPDPFPHLVINDFWPDGFYGKLLYEMPVGDDWRRRGDYGMGGKTLIASRVVAQHHWLTCYGVLESEAFMDALCAKWQVDPGSSMCLLHKDLDGYSISPHTDALSKRVAYVLYMAPEDVCVDHLGTYLLKPGWRAVPESWGDSHQPWYQFDVAALHPYMANSFISWPRTDKSFHAVDVRFRPHERVRARHSVRGFVFDYEADLPFIFQEDLRERSAG